MPGKDVSHAERRTGQERPAVDAGGEELYCVAEFPACGFDDRRGAALHRKSEAVLGDGAERRVKLGEDEADPLIAFSALQGVFPLTRRRMPECRGLRDVDRYRNQRIMFMSCLLQQFAHGR